MLEIPDGTAKEMLECLEHLLNNFSSMQLRFFYNRTKDDLVMDFIKSIKEKL